MAYVKAEGLLVLEIDILKTKLTGTKIVELENRLYLEIKELVNQEHPAYTRHFDHHDFSSDNWIKMIGNNLEIMKLLIA